MNRHLTNDELLDRLYGIADPAAEKHVLECADCAGRYASFQRRRAETAHDSIPAGALAAQRRAIYARIDAARTPEPRWTPAFAAGLLLLAGVILYRPPVRIADRPAPAPVTRAEISDTQLFSDVYSIEASAEPRAAEPIQGLFESSEANEEGQQ